MSVSSNGLTILPPWTTESCYFLSTPHSMMMFFIALYSPQCHLKESVYFWYGTKSCQVTTSSDVGRDERQSERTNVMPNVPTYWRTEDWVKWSTFSKWRFPIIFLGQQFCFASLFRIQRHLSAGGLTDNTKILLQLMISHRIGAKPLLEPMKILFTDIHIHASHWVSWC